MIRVTTAFAGVRPATARSIGHVKLRTVRYSRRLALSVGSMSIVASLVVAPAAGGLGAHENDVTPSYGVGVTRCTFVDRSRNVLDYATSPPTVLARQRTIVTEIRYPTLLRSSQPETTNAPPAPTFGYPLVVFAHGYDVTPGIYAALLERWAQRGFVVAAPIFPDENSAEVRRQRVDTEADLVNEPADMAFVIRQLLADSATLAASCPLVHGLVAPNEVALAGHSDGADAVALLADSNGRDPQGVPYARLRQGLMIRATMIFSGSTHGTAPYSAQPTRPPMLLVQRGANSTPPSTRTTNGSSNSCTPTTCHRSMVRTTVPSRSSRPRRRRSSTTPWIRPSVCRHSSRRATLDRSSRI